jgi:cyanophycin synthetase
VARGIPYRRLTGAALVQLAGARQPCIQATEMDATSAVSESITQDKDLTALAPPGVPVPQVARSAVSTTPGRLRRSCSRGGQAAGRQPGQGRHCQHHASSQMVAAYQSAVGMAL